jgi:L-alanine-DL-glutamate epimerase-like enolase superfamily enzyme
MAKVDAEYVKTVYSRLKDAKQALYDANQALHQTQEYRAAKKAEHDMDLAEDCLIGLQTIMNQRTV